MRKLALAALALAAVSLASETVAFAHDRWVISQDFDCLDAALAHAGKTRDGAGWQPNEFPQCHLVTLKLFGLASARAWVSGVQGPWGMLEQLLMMGRAMLPAIPFLFLSFVMLAQRKTTGARLVRVVLSMTVLAIVAFFAVRQHTFSPQLLRLPEAERIETFRVWSSVLVAIYFGVFASVVGLAVAVLRKNA